MKILLTVHQFLPEFQAGTEILTLQTAKALRARGHDVTVFTGFPARERMDDSRRFDSYVHDGIRVERFHHEHAPFGGETNVSEMEYNNRFFAGHFRDYLTKARPDVVHFFHLQRLSASAIDVCHEIGIPMVYTATDFWLVCPTGQLLLPNHALCTGPDPQGINCLRHVATLTQAPLVGACLNLAPDMLVRAVIRAVDAGIFPRHVRARQVRALSARPRFMKSRIDKVNRVTVPTRLMADVFAGNGVNKTKIVFLPYGINVNGLSPNNHEDCGNTLRVGFIGTLIEHKGAHILFQAVRLLPADFPVEVKVYGSTNEFPDYAAKLRRIAAGDPRITFRGTFPNSDIGRIFSSLDVLVVPSIWYENTPLVIYSAQACGCPVAASNLGGMSEAVAHEENGLLFEAGNPNALAQALRRLAVDRTLLRELRQKARKPKPIVEYAAELENVYKDLLAERRMV